MDELWRISAYEAVSLIRRGEITPTDLLEVAAARIEAIDGTVNALPIRCFERARAQAFEWTPKRIRAADARSLLGLPVAVKDYNDVGGVRTTYGSPIFAENVAPLSDATVARLERNGAVPIAKSNVPEWAGGHTFNPVFGTTRNP